MMVPRPGVEPGRPCGHRFLRPTRLPVPPPRRAPEGLRTYHSPVRSALAALALLTILTACGPTIGTPSANVTPGGATAVAAAASRPRVTQPPVTPPPPPATNLPPFACSDAPGAKTRVAH